MAKNFKTLPEKMPPTAGARAEAKARNLITAMPLDELREARHVTQEHLARLLGVRQSAISKLERRADMYVSTLGDSSRRWAANSRFVRCSRMVPCGSSS